MSAADFDRSADARAALVAQYAAERAAREAAAIPTPAEAAAGTVRRRRTEGRPHTAGVAVTTWADGWGRYHARVTGAATEADARRRAAARIRERFADADGWGAGFRLHLVTTATSAADTVPAVVEFTER